MKNYKKIDFYFDWSKITSIDEAIKQLKEMKKAGATHIDANSYDAVYFSSYKEFEEDDTVKNKNLSVKIKYEQRNLTF